MKSLCLPNTVCSVLERSNEPVFFYFYFLHASIAVSQSVKLKFVLHLISLNDLSIRTDSIYK